MTLKDTLRDQYHAVNLQAKGLVGFELMYKPAVVLIMSALLALLLRLAMKIQHISYLKPNNLRKFLHSPVSLGFLFFWIVVLLFFSMLEMLAITHALAAAHQGERLTGVDIFRSTIFTLKEMFSLKLFLTFPFVFAMTVFTSYPSIVLATTNTGIPEYFQAFLSRNQGLNTILHIMVLVLLFLLSMRCIVFCFSATSGLSLSQSWAACSSLNSRRFWKNTAIMLVWYALLIAFIFAVYFVTVIILGLIVKIVVPSSLKVLMFLRCTRLMAMYLSFILELFFFPIYYSMMVTIYARWKKSEDKKVCSSSYGEPYKHKKHVKVIMVIAVTIVLLADSSGCAYLYFSNVFDDIVFTRRAEVAAHRGSEKRAPENTMEAIRLAIEEDADYVEIDVRLSRDGFVILSHDESLKRTAGVDKLVSEMDYAEILQYDVSGEFHDKYGTVRIPTLEQVIDLTRGKVKLIVELKPNEKDKGIAEATMDVLARKEFVGKCLIQSFDYDCLKVVKSIAPEQECGIIFKVPAGIYAEMEGIDFYTVKVTFLSDTYIEKMHALGRRVFVWGGMKNIAICEMNNLGVDVFIATDSVRYASVLSEQRSNWVERLVGKWFYGGNLFRINRNTDKNKNSTSEHNQKTKK